MLQSEKLTMQKSISESSKVIESLILSHPLLRPLQGVSNLFVNYLEPPESGHMPDSFKCP